MSNSSVEPQGQAWEDVKAGLGAVLKSRAFWAALTALVQSVVFRVWPDFPTDIWNNATLLFAAILVAVGVAPAAYRGVQARRQKARMIAQAAQAVK